MAKQHIPSLALAVVQKGNVVKMKAYGLANLELNVPAAPNSVYQLQSITKSFVACAIMLLVEDRKLGLDDKITKYLSGLPRAWSDITVRQLLTHTSGIPGFIQDQGGWQPMVAFGQTVSKSEEIATATSILVLAERGELHLGEEVTRFLPKDAAPLAGITLRHLLTHTSGISDQSLDTLDWRRDYAEEELVRLAAAQPLLFTPGESESYSGTGYHLAGMIIEKVTANPGDSI